MWQLALGKILRLALKCEHLGSAQHTEQCSWLLEHKFAGYVHPVCAAFNFLLGDRAKGFKQFKLLLKHQRSRANLLNFYRACKLTHRLHEIEPYAALLAEILPRRALQALPRSHDRLERLPLREQSVSPPSQVLARNSHQLRGFRLPLASQPGQHAGPELLVEF